MTAPTFPAAHLAAETVSELLGRHIAGAAARGEADVAPLPDVDAIAALVDAAFWASLRREEGRSPRISLALLPPDRAGHPLLLERSLPLAADALARMSPAVERPGIHLGVWRTEEGLRVWGATRRVPTFCLVLEVVEPGLLVLKYRREEEFGKFGNVAVLRGSQLQVVDERSASLPECPEMLASLLGFAGAGAWVESGNVLVQLAISMRQHGRGGALLVVPEESHGWRDSIVRPVLYSVSPAFEALAEVLARGPDEDDADRHEVVRQQVDAIAGLTAVDGAAVMTNAHRLLAFGAKIARRDGGEPVEWVTVTEPIVGNVPRVVEPSRLGGTRHLSAAQFVHDQRDALGLVASQDGRFTVFVWSPCEQMVHAHRLEALLW